MATYKIGGVDLINDASGIRRADGKPWAGYLDSNWNYFANPNEV